MDMQNDLNLHVLQKLNPFMPSIPQKRTLANNVDPNQMLQNVASDQGLHCINHRNFYEIW